MDEDFKLYVLVDLIGPGDGLMEPDQSLPIVILEKESAVR